MKKLISVIVILLAMAVSAKAMSYEQARQQALFLTDKMAYELNLTDAQYEAAYEVNLDYLMGVNTYDDLYGAYWRQRNLDLQYILLDWQFRAYCDAAYFYRPLYWDAGFWHFGIYARYPQRDYFYFGRPRVFVEYRGGHSWRMNGGRSWYNGRNFGPQPGKKHFGMRDGFNRGDFGNGNRLTFGNRQQASYNSSFGNRQRQGGSNGNVQQNNRQNSAFGNRQSSTRTTVNQQRDGNANSTFGTRRSGQTTTVPRSTFTPSTQNRTTQRETFGSGRSGQSGTSRTTPSIRQESLPSVQRNSSSSFGSNRGGNSFSGNRGGSSSFGTSKSSSHSGGGTFGGRR